MKKIVMLSLVGSLVAGCSTQSQRGKWASNPYEASLDQAFAQLKTTKMTGRVVASETEVPKELSVVSANFRDLSTDFEVLVFPKKSDITEKHIGHEKAELRIALIKKFGKTDGLKKYDEVKNDNLVEYQKPVSYRFSDQRMTSCYNIVKENSKKWNAKDFFGSPEVYRKHKDKQCAIIQVKQVSPKIRVSKIRKDDVLAMRIFIDDMFRPYGKEIDIARVSKARYRKGQVGRVRIPYSNKNSMSSELSYFPIDIPNFLNNKVKLNWNYVETNALSIPNDYYVKNKIEKLVKVDLCDSGYTTAYSDIYGRTVKVGWCKGHSWPTTITTNNFFAVLKRGAKSSSN